MSEEQKSTKTRRIVPIGPYHPLQEEPEFFKLIVEGETVVDMEINIGYNHRGHEFISPELTYDQIPFLVERICGICSNSHPLACVLAIEDCAGIEPPPRANYIRSIIHELERIHSHLLWVGLGGHFIGYNTVWMWAWKYREHVLQVFEMITGNRNHYAANKPGGVRRDISKEQVPQVLAALDLAEEKTKLLTNAVLDDPVILGRLANVGILTKADAIAYSTVGPTSRGSGVPWDVRKDDPHAAYAEVPWDRVVFEEGDVLAKAKVRLLETFESIKIVRGCLENLPDGPIEARIEEIPPGEGIGHTEAPRGEVFHYIRSDGSNRPLRHKVRAPSFMNIASNVVAVRGGSIADAALTLAAVDPCYCCTERMAAFEDGRLKYTWNDLLKLSWQKTERLREKLK
ncbi:MAG: nickel-dependent hydrogenase large subunit [candidate division WOR-3 bacterium]|nr:MAG: nickel-dependent hydrogenase large subunit [candidate division WOR-3 bacterium]